MVNRGALYAAAPRFSVYLEALALERERAARDEIVPVDDSKGRCECDTFEMSDELVARLERTEPSRPAAAVETIQRVRVQLTSPAGRFLDLLM